MQSINLLIFSQQCFLKSFHTIAPSAKDAFPLNHYIHISTTASPVTCSSSTKKTHHLNLQSSIRKALLTHTLASFWRKQSCKNLMTGPHGWKSAGPMWISMGPLGFGTEGPMSNAWARGPSLRAPECPEMPLITHWCHVCPAVAVTCGLMPQWSDHTQASVSKWIAQGIIENIYQVSFINF